MTSLGAEPGEIVGVVEGLERHGVAADIGDAVMRSYTDPSGACFDVLEEPDGTGIVSAFLQSRRPSPVEAVARVGEGRLWSLRVGHGRVEPFEVCARVDRLDLRPGPATVSLTGLVEQLSVWTDEASYLASGGGRSVMAPESLVAHGLDQIDEPRPYAFVTGIVEQIEREENSLTRREFAVLTVRTWGVTLAIAAAANVADGVDVGCVVQGDCLLVASPVAAVDPDLIAPWDQLERLAEDVLGYRLSSSRLCVLALDGDQGAVLLSYELDEDDGSPYRCPLPAPPNAWSASEDWVALAFDDHTQVLDRSLRPVYSRPDGPDAAPVTAVAAGHACVWFERRSELDRSVTATRTEVTLEQVWPMDGTRAVVPVGTFEASHVHAANRCGTTIAGGDVDVAVTIEAIDSDGDARQVVVRTSSEAEVARTEWAGPPWICASRSLVRSATSPDDLVEVDVLAEGLLVDGSWAIHHGVGRTSPPQTAECDGGVAVSWRLDRLVVALVHGEHLHCFTVQQRRWASAAGPPADRWVACHSRDLQVTTVLARLRNDRVEHVASMPPFTDLVAVRPGALIVSEITSTTALAPDEVGTPIRRLYLVPRLKGS